MKRILSRFLCVATCAWSAGSFGASDADLTSLSLEQLMNEPVTSVSKKETRIGDSPTAITVVTQDDLRRMGITTLPEALRLAPGVDVARVGPSQWAVSARGFNGEFATKILVLIDGRTVYSPSSGGVFWNSEDVLIDDIDRIEIIRGPGASLWGANAVNGVINVITRSARETAGARVTGVGGSEDNVLAKLRYGGAVGEDLHWRAFLKYFDRESFEDSTGTLTAGHWNTLHGGFRADWAASGSDDLTVQGDAYDGRAGKVVNHVSLIPISVTPYSARFSDTGANILGRWNHAFSDDSAVTVQTYFDHVDQGDGYGTEYRNTYDLEAQHHFRIDARNDFMWGAGLRYVSSDEREGSPIFWMPDTYDVNFFNFFLQDQLTLIPQQLTATVASKFEHNDLSGWFIDPNLRLAWTPTSRQTVWAALARASRTPSEFELGANLGLDAQQPNPNAPPVVVAVLPNADLRPEQLLSYELGYRFEPVGRVSVDLATYFNRFSHLIAQQPAGTQLINGPLPYVLVAWRQENSQDAKNFGFEAALQYQATAYWKLLASYTFLHMNVWPDVVTEHESPHDQVQLRSYLDLPWHLELNSAIYYVDGVTVPAGATYAAIPSYVRFDAGLYWKPNDTWSFGLWGQNLTSARHLEFASNNTSVLFPVPRSWSLRINWNH
jgi:iron complex outermembrane recepter protein